MCWTGYRLLSSWTALVNKKISNINVVETLPTPTPTPIATPIAIPTVGPSSEEITIANNELYQQIWQVQKFDASSGLMFAGKFDSVTAIASSESAEPVYISPDTPSQLPETREKVETYWPDEMSASESQSIVVVLQNKSGAPIVPSINVADYQRATSNATEISKPNVEYEAYASAALDGATFETKLNSLEWQSLKRPKAEWIWSVTPKVDRQVRGNQSLNAAIKVQFKDRSGKTIAEDQLWQGNVQIAIYHNWFLKDPPNVTSLITMFFGAGITVPWIYDRIRSRTKTKYVRRNKKRRRGRHHRR